MSHFAKLYLLMLSILVPILWVLHSLDNYSGMKDLSLITISVFTLTSLLSYLILGKLVLATNKQLFISYTMANTLIKMAVSVIILIAYKHYNHAIKDGKFVVPFILIYMFFTIFETKILMHKAQQKPAG